MNERELAKKALESIRDFRASLPLELRYPPRPEPLRPELPPKPDILFAPSSNEQRAHERPGGWGNSTMRIVQNSSRSKSKNAENVRKVTKEWMETKDDRKEEIPEESLQSWTNFRARQSLVRLEKGAKNAVDVEAPVPPTVDRDMRTVMELEETYKTPVEYYYCNFEPAFILKLKHEVV